MPDVFLSYSREDQVTARRYAEALQREGFSVWWDQALNPGEAFDQVTEQALEESSAVIVLWSKTSVNSRWVRAEATQAHANNRLVPVMIEPCKRPIMFELTHTAELAEWKGEVDDPAWQAFAASLRRFTGKPAAAAPRTAAISTPAPSPRSPRLIRWGAVVAALLIAAGLAWFVQHRANGGAATKPEASVVVLPFTDESPEKGQADYAGGISDQIRDTLGRIEGLKVTPPTSSLAIREKAGNPREVGAKLGVAHQLEGKVSRSAGRLRISVWLVSTATGQQVWSQIYDRPQTEVFQLRDDISAQVAQALQVKLGIGIASQPGMTRDVAAFEAYLASQALWAQFSAETRRASITQLELAVSRDPDFALAWRQLSDAARTMPTLLGAKDAAAQAQFWQAKDDTAGRRFEQLMQGTPELLLWRAERAGSLVEAARNLEAAAQQAKKLGLQWNDRGFAPFLVQVGRTREAIPALEQERARDPLNPAVVFALGNAYNDAGDFAAVLALIEQAERDLPEARVLLNAMGTTVALGTKDEALLRRRLDIGTAVSPVSTDFNERIKRVLGKPAAALQFLTATASEPNISPLQLGIIAYYRAYFGDPEGALAIITANPVAAAYVNRWAPLFSDMRKLPAFRQMMRELGVVDYWRAYQWADLCKPTTGDDFECR